MTTSISEIILACCQRFGSRAAVTDGDLIWSYETFGAQIRAWAGFFDDLPGIDRIGFALPNSAQYLAALYGAVHAQKTPFLIDNALGATEIAAIVNETGIDALLTDDPASAGDELARHDGIAIFATCPNAAPQLDAETAVCRFTTGTSGAPKCLEFSHRAVYEAAQVWRRSNDMSQDDTILCLSGFFNGLAFNTSLLASFLSGANLAVYRGWLSPAQVLRYAAQTGATRLIGFPVFYQLLASSGLPGDAIPGCLQSLYSAASALSDDTRERLADTYGLSIVNYYGIAEAGPVTTDRIPGSTRGNGAALIGCDIRTRAGVLEVRTPYLASRYLTGPDDLSGRMTPDGYFRTGDRAEIRNGRLFLAGRTSNILDVGGKKFPASDVTRAILALPGVTDAYVFGEATADRGTRVCAAISGNKVGSETAIRRQLTATLARHKLPYFIRVLHEMPRNAAGKIDASRIRKIFQQGVKENA